MRVERAEHLGFCDGVQRAVRLAQDALQDRKLFALGPLAHNKHLIAELAALGLETIEDLAALPMGATLIVRSHGATRQDWETMERGRDLYGWQIIDATCPCVQRIFDSARAQAVAGRHVLILGEHDHPEVEATLSWAGERATVVASYDEVTALLAEGLLTKEQPIAVVCQSTLEEPLFLAFSQQFRRDFQDNVVLSTRCPATRLRQEAAAVLAKRAERMIVIGDRHSANTRHLYDLCRTHNPSTLLVEKAEDLPDTWLNGASLVGITAGASTPERIIEEVETKVTDWEKKEETAGEPAVEAEVEQEARQDVPQPIEESPASPTESQSEVAELAAGEEGQPEDPHPETEIPEPLPGTECQEAGEVEHPEETVAVEAEEASVEVEEVAVEAEEAASDEEAPEFHDESAEGEMAAALQMGDFDLPRHSIGDIIKATVVKIHNDEVMVDVGLKSEGVIPRRELSFDTSIPADEIVSVGEEIEVEVLRSEDQEGRITFSKKRADQMKNWDRILEARANDEIIEGKVIDIVKGGLLVDIGVRGFMPASQAERRYVNDLKYLVGQTVRVKLIDVETSKERHRAIVSRKAVLEAEAEIAKAAFWGRVHEGDTVRGIVRRLTDFGAFVDLGGVDGLLHISDMAYHHVTKPSDIVSIGQELDLRILKLSPDTSRVSLGLKQLQPKPWEALSQELLQGDVIEGTVVRITAWGAFVNVRPGIDGLIHISELDVHHVAKVDDIVKIGERIQVVVLGVNPEKERLSLSLKSMKMMQQGEDLLEEEEYPEEYLVTGEETPADEVEGEYVEEEGEYEEVEAQEEPVLEAVEEEAEEEADSDEEPEA